MGYVNSQGIYVGNANYSTPNPTPAPVSSGGGGGGSVSTPVASTTPTQPYQGTNGYVNSQGVYVPATTTVPIVYTPPSNTSVVVPTATIGTQPIQTTPTPVVGGLSGTLAGYNTALGLNANGSNPTQYNPDGTPVSNTSTSTDTSGTTGTTQKKSLSDYLTSMLGLQPKTNTAQQDLIDSQNQSGVNAAQIQKNNTQSQINGITTQAQVAMQTLESQAGGKGVTSDFLGRQQQEITRQAAIQALPLQAQLATDQGNLDLATKMASDLYQAKREDATTAVNQWNTAYKMAFDEMTNDQKTQADALKQTYDTNTSQLTNAVNYSQTLTSAAINSGQSTVASSIMKLTPPNANSATFASDLQNYNSQVAALAGQITAKATTPTTTPSNPASPKLSPTQLNTGSSRLGITTSEFTSLDPQIQTYFVGSQGNTFMGMIADVQSGKSTYTDAKSSIDASIQPQVVKDYMQTLLDKAAPQTTNTKPWWQFW